MKKHETRTTCRTNRLCHRPRVDIHETDRDLHLTVDLPGVEEKELELSVEDGILTLVAPARAEGEVEPRYREFRLRGYHRQFQLPAEVDTDSIDARLNDGVLHLTLPRREEAQAKKIAVSTE